MPQYTLDQKLRILHSLFELVINEGRSISDACKAVRITRDVYYNWRKIPQIRQHVDDLLENRDDFIKNEALDVGLSSLKKAAKGGIHKKEVTKYDSNGNVLGSTVTERKIIGNVDAAKALVDFANAGNGAGSSQVVNVNITADENFSYFSET